MNDTVEAVADFLAASALSKSAGSWQTVGEHFSSAFLSLLMAFSPKYVPSPIPTRPTPPTAMPTMRWVEPGFDGSGGGAGGGCGCCCAGCCAGGCCSVATGATAIGAAPGSVAASDGISTVWCAPGWTRIV